MLEHAEDGVEEFTHGGDQGLHLGFAARLNVCVVGANLVLVLDGDQGGHVERPPQVFVAGLGDANFFVHRSARTILARIAGGAYIPHYGVYASFDGSKITAHPAARGRLELSSAVSC